MMEFKDIYELMRAYKSSNMVINKSYIGCRVKEFLDIPSYKQIIRDSSGREEYYQYFEFSVPFYIKRERRIERYLKRIEDRFSKVIQPIEDDEIEYYNQYWDMDFIGLVYEFLPYSSACVISPSGESYYFSLVEGKELSDVFQIFFKPIPYTGGVI